jgi:hypothetical protein
MLLREKSASFLDSSSECDCIQCINTVIKVLFAQTMEWSNTAGCLVKGDASFDCEISQGESGKGKVNTSYHKVSEWFALPEDERKKIMAARDKQTHRLLNLISALKGFLIRSPRVAGLRWGPLQKTRSKMGQGWWQGQWQQQHGWQV